MSVPSHPQIQWSAPRDHPDHIKADHLVFATRRGSVSEFKRLYPTIPEAILPPISYLLHLACLSHSAALVREILSMVPISPERWPSHSSAMDNTPRTLSRVYIVTAIQAVILRGDTEILQALIDAGLPLNKVLDCSHQGTPQQRIEGLLELAIVENQAALVTQLLEHGADANRRISSAGVPCSMVSLAAMYSTPEILRHIVTCGEGKIAGSYALCHALERGAWDNVEVLMELGVDVNELLYPDSFSEAAECQGTALHAAVTFGSVEAVRWLLEHGADVRIKDGRGKTPGQVAEEKGCVEEIRDLIRKGTPGVGS